MERFSRCTPYFGASSHESRRRQLKQFDVWCDRCRVEGRAYQEGLATSCSFFYHCELCRLTCPLASRDPILCLAAACTRSCSPHVRLLARVTARHTYSYDTCPSCSMLPPPPPPQQHWQEFPRCPTCAAWRKFSTEVRAARARLLTTCAAAHMRTACAHLLTQLLTHTRLLTHARLLAHTAAHTHCSLELVGILFASHL